MSKALYTVIGWLILGTSILIGIFALPLLCVALSQLHDLNSAIGSIMLLAFPIGTLALGIWLIRKGKA
jgi:hypothetical protein